MKKTPLALAVAALLLAGCQESDDAINEPGRVLADPPAPLPAIANYKVRDNRDEVFYFVMPDRFHNGDSSNDLGGYADATEAGFDPTDKSYYHGGDIAGLKEKLDYLEGMGVTAIWMTPMFKNQPVQGDSAAYHGYWINDFTQVDPHFGSNEELKDFIDEAHSRNMRVFFDVITNHTADVIKYEECHEPDGSFKEGLNGCEYRSLERSATAPYTPFVPAGKEELKVPAWLNDTANYHNQGDSTFSGEDSVKGDFFGLDDLASQKPEVIEGFVELAKGWIDEFGVDGFRIDTVKHVDIEFWQQWAPEVLEHAKSKGVQNFFMFGEVYSADPKVLSTYTTKAKLPSVLDFGIQNAVGAVFAGDAGTDALLELFAQDDRYSDADSDANVLMNFAGNHDMGRIGHFIQNFSRDDVKFPEEEWLPRAKLANAFLFFARGIPVIYYGDEQGFTGAGGDKEARQSMFPSQVDEFNEDIMIGTDVSPEVDNFDPEHPLYLAMRDYAEVYRAEPALRRGVQHVRFSEDKPGLFAFSRVESGEPEYLVVFNSSDSTQSLALPASAEGYQPIYTSSDEAGAEMLYGQVIVTVPALDFVIYKANAPHLGSIDVPGFMLSGVTEGYRVAGELNLTIDTFSQRSMFTNLPDLEAKFYASFDSGEPQLLATDVTPPYQLIWDTTGIQDGVTVDLTATLGRNGMLREQSTSFIIDSRVPTLEITYDNANNRQFAYTIGNSGAINGPYPFTDGMVSVPWSAKDDSAQLVFASIDGETKRLQLDAPVSYTRSDVVNHADRIEAVVPLNLGSQPALDGSVIESAPFEDLNVRGGVNGWGADQMSYLGEGTYRGTLFVNKGDSEFKFADKDWASVNIGGPVSANGLTKSSNPGNLNNYFAETGLYDFYLQVVETADGTQQFFPFVQPLPIYLRGLDEDWGTTNVLSYAGERKFQAEVSVDNVPWGFKVASENWSSVNWGMMNDGDKVEVDVPYTLKVGADNNVGFDADGSTYRFTVNAADMATPTVTIEQLE